MSDWWSEAEERRAEIVAGYESHDLPRFLEGDDIFQDVCEWLLRKGWDEESPMGVVDVFKVKGVQVIRNAIRKERGEAGSGPRSFGEVSEEVALVSGPEDFVGIGRDIREALKEIESGRDRVIFWGRYALGLSLNELSELYGLSRTSIHAVLEKSLVKVKRFLEDYNNE